MAWGIVELVYGYDVYHQPHRLTREHCWINLVAWHAVLKGQSPAASSSHKDLVISW